MSDSENHKTAESVKAESIGGLAYAVGGLAFMPLFGVLFGIAAIVWGLVTNKSGGKRVASLGAGGIGLTVLLYGSLFYFGFVQRGGIYDEIRVNFAQSSLNTLVPAIEFYKIQNNQYLESLEELQRSLPKGSFVLVQDPIIVAISKQHPSFYYKRVDADHYYLRSVGPDGEPFTKDDIIPQITSGGKIGLLIDQPPD